jgi:two-component system, NarL family, response regulator NreC
VSTVAAEESTRWRSVLRLLVSGFTNLEAAERLGVSVKTVETHRANLYRKLGARSRADLVRYAAGAGLLQPDQFAEPR